MFEQLNTVLVGKLAEDKLLRGRELRIGITVVEADIDHPPTLNCWSTASANWGSGAADQGRRGSTPDPIPRPPPRGRRRIRQISRTLRCHTGQALGETDRLTSEIATIATPHAHQRDRADPQRPPCRGPPPRQAGSAA